MHTKNKLKWLVDCKPQGKKMVMFRDNSTLKYNFSGAMDLVMCSEKVIETWVRFSNFIHMLDIAATLLSCSVLKSKGHFATLRSSEGVISAEIINFPWIQL